MTMLAEQPRDADVTSDVGTIARARAAGAAWARVPLKRRVVIFRQLRHAVVDRADEIAAALSTITQRRVADSLAAEVLPVLDGIRFLERNLTRLLRPQRLGRAGRPAWLPGSDLTIYREPLGVVLVIGPSNYPLFLPVAHALQAIAAGNAVLVKPAPGCEQAVDLLAQIATTAGLPAGLLTVLASDVQAARDAIGQVDHVVFTGSFTAGHAVLAEAAEHVVPATLELSGHDAVFILPGANLELASRALRFGLTFNNSATCIAPRRVFVPADMLSALNASLSDALRDLPTFRASPPSIRRARSLASNAIELGGRLLAGNVPTEDASTLSPILLTDVPHGARVLRDEAFAPLLAVVPVASVDEALSLAAQCKFALGATIFGPADAATALAQRVNAGCVVINDCIAPTADPRLPFGGRGHSGFGVTRGADGLLAMTRPKAVASRSGTFRPHYDKPHESDATMFAAYLHAAHGRSVGGRVRAALQLMKTLATRGKGSPT
ncbi:MAG TPA: aldehyde dehydrogenase family protein [Tepidisphaeraceae bacterium]|jgi:acyl-CoA reductase-like NAD-dependent aldehyde dehydrogenase|nr:aldehyde dehydrogenase family protein [Tepidisphaeraceae bacterium]